MTEETNFIDQLIAEAEADEAKQTQSYYDLLLLEIGKLEDQIARNFSEAEKEMEIIKQWALEKNDKLKNRIEYYERKLEAYIREEKQKTIDLPHGTLKLHRKPDKVEVSDMESFLEKAKPELLKIIPETVKPDLNKIKAFIKLKGRVPEGVNLIEGQEEFKYKLNNNGKDNSND